MFTDVKTLCLFVRLTGQCEFILIKNNVSRDLMSQIWRFILNPTQNWHILTAFISYQCQAEEQQRDVCEPRDPVAAALPEERYQQVSPVERG